MHWADLVGYLASGLVVLTFYMNDMISLRIVAIFSNIAFLGYGTSLGLGPVVVLHGMLLPLNVWRLHQAHRARLRATDPCDAALEVRDQGRIAPTIGFLSRPS